MTVEVRVTEDLAACLALRRAVFIEEQGVPEADELDDLDGQAVHLLALVEGEPLGSARLLRSGDTGKIGRVCVLAAARGTGLGVALMGKALEVLAADPALRRAKLSSQTHALGFYERLGFVAEGADYLDAGIPHRDMVRALR